MFHSGIMNNKINHLHKRCLRKVYGDKSSSFEKLLETDRSVPMHIRNLQILAIEIFKVSKDLDPTFFSEFFSKQSAQYNLGHVSEPSVPNLKSISHSTESSCYLGPKIWELVPVELKGLSSSSAFKKAIQKWKPQIRPYRLCKKYVQNFVFFFHAFSNILDKRLLPNFVSFVRRIGVN